MRICTPVTQALFAVKAQTPVKVSLPHTWNALDGQDGGGDYYRGDGCYTIDLPAHTPGKRQYIEFQAANHRATVWCNGVELGTHKGGFSVFRFELTDYLKESGNQLTVTVNNEVQPIYPQRADFTFFGGLYRDVTFIETEQAHFDLLKNGTQGVFVTPRAPGSTRVDLFPVNAAGCTVTVELLDADGNCVATGTEPAAAHTTLQLKVKNPHLWDGMKDPYCYKAKAVLSRDGRELDTVEVTYGYRSFRVDAETGFWLNGKSVPLHGVCRHQDRLNMGWAISKREHEEDVALIKEIGANTIRLAHYQQAAYFYDLCDKTGFVIWAEIPFISQFLEGKEAYDNTISQMTELIAQNYNHPSICFWGIGNELTIGGFSEGLYQNLCDLNALCKKLDPSRLTTMAQIAGVPIDSEHVYITDVQSYNYYFGWYSGVLEDNGPRLDAFHKANPDRPYGVSEYGVDNLLCWHSAKPFNHDYTEEYAVKYHQHMLKVFAERPYLWATHMWNMFDFAVDARNEGGIPGQNFKGLISLDRKTKKDSFFVYKAWWTKEPMVHISGRRFKDRAPDERDVIVFTNEQDVSLIVNGKEFATHGAVDHQVIFENVPLHSGENTITAKTANAEDTICLCGVEVHNPDYDLPDVMEALNAGNWFSAQTDEVAPVENGFNIHMPVGEVFANDTCIRAVKGWIMGKEGVTKEQKLVLCSRLTNWQAMWGDKKIPQLTQIGRIMTTEDYEKLDRILNRIPK